MIRTKTTREILNEILGYLVSHTDITLVQPGSTARSLVESVAGEIASLYQTVDSTIVNMFPSTARGPFLDLVGELVGVTRLTQLAPRTSASDLNIRFYVETGNLGAQIPKPGDATIALIPAGTTVETADGTVTFTVDLAHEAPAGATEIYVTARAQTFGLNANVGPGVLSVHSLGNPNVLVENRETVATGREIETDDQMRFRIQNAVRTAEGANIAAIRSMALSTPGVTDVRLRPFVAGSGSFEVLVLPIGNRVPTASLNDLQALIAAKVAYGTTFYVREPRYIPFALDVELSMPFVHELEKEAVRTNVRSSVLGYLGNLRPDDTLVINRVREAILSANSGILDVTIRALRINREAQPIRNIKLGEDEIFIPDPQETDPVLVR